MHYVKGRTTTQAHVSIPDGTIEEEYGRGGFSGRVSHLYRAESPLGWSDIEGDCRPEALDLNRLTAAGTDWLTARVAFLKNADVTLHFATLTAPMDYHFRNADADEVLFVHEGGGRIETDFGPLHYEQGDYLVIPRGTVYRLLPHQPSRFLVIESVGEVGIPERGLLGRHALFDMDVLKVPTPEANMPEPGRTAWPLFVQRCGRHTRVTYPFNPIQTVGYKGDLTVWQLNVRDIRPVMSERYHLPPTAHATFIAANVVICTFLPRGLETGDPEALRVPFFHANIDYDEVLFYHDGDFFSRDGIKAGMVTFHPQGIHHGPHPKAVEGAGRRERTNEQAVMVDTRNPLEVTAAGRAVCNPDYWASWKRPTTERSAP